MRVKGREIPQPVLDAGLRAMRGEFTSATVQMAIVRTAGKEFDWGPAEDWVLDRTANRLLQRERKAGRIRFIAGSWREVKQDA